MAVPDFPFRIEREIGRGATSAVYRATATETGVKVALKVGRGPEQAPRLADEAELLALVESRSLAKVLGAGFAPDGLAPIGGRPYVAFEWVDGESLDPRALAPSERRTIALAVARDVGDALSELHATGVAHGDVKPENVVLSRDANGGARAVLVDLGLHTFATEASPRGGTVRYLAPECFEEAANLGDARARDQFALGITLAEVASDSVASSTDPRTAGLAGVAPELLPLIRALLGRTPGARPSADWVARRARDALGEANRPTADGALAIRRAYLGTRRRELLPVARGRRATTRVEGAPGAWLEQAILLLSNVATLRGPLSSKDPLVLSDLDALGRSRFLVRLVGPRAASWPVPNASSDARLVDRLIERVRSVDTHALGLADFLDEAGTATDDPVPSDPLAIAVLLGSGSPAAAVLDRAEVLATEPGAQSLALALGRALRLAGQTGRALAVLARLDFAEAKVEGAECARRAGDRASAEAFLDAVDPEKLGGATKERWYATRARVHLDAGDVDRALAVTDAAPRAAPVLEVRALAEIARGNLARAKGDAERARALSKSNEERARSEAVIGNLAHAAGEVTRALEAFRRATDFATRAGARLEEATYSTGLAAAAFEAGEIAEALDAATRAALLFEALGRPLEAARALLARAAAFGAASAVDLASEAAELAIAHAKSAGDARCRAFSHLVLADVLPLEDANGLEHAERARAILENASAEDHLRVAARVLRRGGPVDLAALDPIGEDPKIGSPARLEWWGARADVQSRERSPERPDRVLLALSALAAAPGPVATKGEALAAGVALAARIGDGDAARRFATASAEAARKLVQGAPPELRNGVLSLPWVEQVRSPREKGILPEQIADIESLVRALGTRDRLRPLLDQVLDALILWTGVERGLLLLRAPGDRLVPRAARNIARDDLRGEQISLSRSLAERALSSGEPVVAVDAAGELPEVHTSVHALKLRSVLAVPLIGRGEALGVVYLDDRVRRGAFGPAELAWVRLVAALAAVAIADARDQLALRRSARRARRAESRLGETLARREAELDVATRELARAAGNRTTRYVYDDVIGKSDRIRTLLAIVDRVTPTEVPVLICGESGSGKELVARAIHRNGPRGDGPFVGENCGAIPEGLLESTLFGHVRGAFTGASRPHAGLFEVASGGTLFLDEIGEMSLGMQTKLLRVLEDGEVRAVGSERPRKVNVRVIAATHRNLKAMVEDGRFRGDLFYRLNVIGIDVPALRDRPSDIEELARHFIGKHAKGRAIRLSQTALSYLVACPWPGNVRQLENEIRRALVLADEVIRPEHLSPELQKVGAGGRGETGLNVRRRVDALEAELVRAALERTGNNQTRAAELLGLSRFGLQKMIRRLKIAPPLSLSGHDEPGAVSGVR